MMNGQVDSLDARPFAKRSQEGEEARKQDFKRNLPATDHSEARKPSLKRSHEDDEARKQDSKRNFTSTEQTETRPSLKRSHEDDEALKQNFKHEITNTEQSEGLVALVKQRRHDVQLLENKISTLGMELIIAQKKLVAADALLQSMSPPTNGNHDGIPQERNTPGKPNLTSIGLKSCAKGSASDGLRPGSVPPPLRNRSSSHASSDGGEPPAKSRKDNLGGRANSEVGRKDIRANASDQPPGKSKIDNPGGRVPPDSDRRDKRGHDQTSNGDISQRVGKPPTPPRPQPEHVELVSSIKSKLKAQTLSFYIPVYTHSQHRRKMRSLILNPTSENQCATSALDGVVKFWDVHAKGLDITIRYSADCLSPVQRHWPEDIAWHPDGHSLFAVYTADNGDSQVAVIKNDIKKKTTLFLPDKPHAKGLLNGISFMPWSSSQFVTGGSDHSVHMWREREEDVWKPKLLHANLHTSAVYGVAGSRHRQMVLSAGSDKRVILYDPVANRMILKHDLENKAFTVLPNTSDFNLFMVQTAQPNKQLHLFDLRARTQLHTFGWQQDSSDTQSTLITQSWSPDGYYIASGSADPKIVIFDIRYNGREPAQTVLAHTKRVFMAVWHQTLPMLLSISSDLHIGVNRISGK